MGKEIVLTKYDPEFMKDKSTGNVFVKNLPPTTKTSELHNFFKKIAPVFSCCVKYGTNGLCSGYGYIRFETQAAADKAIAEGNRKEFNGNIIEVCAFKPRESRTNGSTAFNNLFVRNIPKTFTNDDLTRLFQPYGEIMSAIVIKAGTDSAENKGFGFVCFKDLENSKKAQEAMNHYQIDGQELFVTHTMPMDNRKKQVSEPKTQISKDCNLHIKNLPESTTDEFLKKAFEKYGKVTSARVMFKQNYNPSTGMQESKPCGYGFVCFDTKESAMAAIEKSKKEAILGQMLQVTIAERKEDRLPKKNGMGFYNKGPYQYRGFPSYPQQYQMPPRYPAQYMNQGQPGMRPSYPMYYPMGPQYMPNMGGMRPPMAPGYAPMGSMPPMTGMRPPQAQPRPNLVTDKEQLGEMLYPLVCAINEPNASKITGMLLELEVEQIHKFLMDSTELRKWVDEAYKVYFISM